MLLFSVRNSFLVHCRHTRVATVHGEFFMSASLAFFAAPNASAPFLLRLHIHDVVHCHDNRGVRRGHPNMVDIKWCSIMGMNIQVPLAHSISKPRCRRRLYSPVTFQANTTLSAATPRVPHQRCQKHGAVRPRW